MREVIRFEDVIRRLESFEQSPVSIMLLCCPSGPSTLPSCHCLPAKAEDIEVEGEVEKFQVVGHRSKDLQNISLTKV